MKYQRISSGFVALSLLCQIACEKKHAEHDASGVFEAQETVISAQIAGQIVKMPIAEGQRLDKGAVAAEIDCEQLLLQRAQIRASEEAISERTTEAAPQLAVLKAEQSATTTQLAVQSGGGGSDRAEALLVFTERRLIMHGSRSTSDASMRGCVLRLRTGQVAGHPDAARPAGFRWSLAAT